MRTLILALLLPGLLIAQERHRGSSKPAPPIAEGPLATQLFKLRMNRLEQTLGLSEDRARTIAERWRRLDHDFVNGINRTNSLKEQMEQILKSSCDESEKNRKIKPLIAQHGATWAQIGESRRKFEEESRAALSPAQQARFILLMDQLHQELERLLKEQRR
jgi:hypothetical protein